MDTYSRQFDSAFNYIINNNFPKAMESFQAAYREHPDRQSFLHGIITSYILLGRLGDLREFMDKEKDVSIHRSCVLSIFRFLKKNDFASIKPIDVLYNVAVFVARHVSVPEAKIYFSTGLTLEPVNRLFLTAIAEYNILEGNYAKGLRFYHQAVHHPANKRN